MRKGNIALRLVILKMKEMRGVWMRAGRDEGSEQL